LYLSNIFFDRNDNFWFHDENRNMIGVLKNSDLDSLRGKFKTECFEQDTAGNFWILDNNTMKCFSGEDNIDKLVDGDYITFIKVIDNINFIDSIIPPDGDTIGHFYIDKQNVFYVTFQSKLGILKNSNWQYLTAENSQLPDGNISRLFVDSSGNIWASMWIPDKRLRIYKYNATIWEDVTMQMSNSGLHGNSIAYFAKDSKNEMWMVKKYITQIQSIRLFPS